MFTSKLIAVILALLMLISFAGCGTSEEKKPDSQSTTTGSSQVQATTAEKKEPVKLTMFMGNAGFPAGDANVSDNPYINVVEKMANVDLEITYPEYADTKTKFDLTMASGTIPDLVHIYYPEEIKKYGLSGAFIALNDIIGNSSVLSKIYPEEMLNAQKASDGNIYGFAAQDAKVPNTTIARIDLIDKLNGGIVPKTPDEWYEFMKKVKQNNPNAVPYSSQGQLKFMDVFFKAYGISMDFGNVSWQLNGEKVICALEHPRMKEAIEFHKKLYSEKLLDQQFVANKGQDWVNRIAESDMCVWNSGPFSFNFINNDWGTNKKIYDKLVGFVGLPVAPDVDPKDVFFRYVPIGMHTISIAKSCKDVEAAVRTIEAFMSPELVNAASWGIEGVDYTNNGGQKVPIVDADKKSSFRGGYLFMYQYWHPENVKHTAILQSLGIQDEAYRKKFLDNIEKSLPIAKAEMDSVGYNPWSLMPSDSVISTKLIEAQTEAASIISKAIVGSISLEQYENDVTKFTSKYADITAAYQKYYDNNKDLVNKIISK